MNKESILKTSSPADLFTLDNIKSEYKELAKKWHPDLAGGDAEVMAHVNMLYTKGLDLVDKGMWIGSNFLKISGRELRYRTSFPFELGLCYVGDSYVAYFIKKEFEKFYVNFLSQVKSIVYPDDKVKKEFERYFPIVRDTFETPEHNVVVIHKTPDVVPLSSLWRYYKGEIPKEHVAWIISRLTNIQTYLHFSNRACNAITLDTLFISPEFHTISLFGGWFYTTPLNAKLLGVPMDVYSVLTPKVKSSKIGTIENDQEAIKLLGRILLGDRNGTTLKKKVPEPMANFLREYKAYKNLGDFFGDWEKALMSSFGKRRFVEMPFDKDKIYE